MQKVFLMPCFISAIIANAGNVSFEVSMHEIHTTCYKVKMTLIDSQKKHDNIPVLDCSRNSYLLRSYAKNNENYAAIRDHKNVKSAKISASLLMGKDDLIKTITLPLLEKGSPSYYLTDKSKNKNNISQKSLSQK